MPYFALYTLVVTLLTSTATADDREPPGPSDWKCTLKAANGRTEFRVGDRIDVDFVMSNVSASSFDYEDWRTMHPVYRVEITTPLGDSASPTLYGIRKLYRNVNLDPGQGRLRAGASRKFRLPLSRAFDLSLSGEYRVRIGRYRTLAASRTQDRKGLMQAEELVITIREK